MFTEFGTRKVFYGGYISSVYCKMLPKVAPEPFCLSHANMTKSEAQLITMHRFQFPGFDNTLWLRKVLSLGEAG